MLALLLGSLLAAGAWAEDPTPPADQATESSATDAEAAREAYQESLERYNDFAAQHGTDSKPVQKLAQETELLRLRYERLEQARREALKRRLPGDREPEDLVESLKDPSMLPALGIIAALTLLGGGILGLRRGGNVARCPCGQKLRLPTTPNKALRVRCPSCGQESVLASG